jgi:MerR family transcriptional regulator/heat shock protein HspR
MTQEHNAVYIISVAAELVGMHPQTLRVYERRVRMTSTVYF